MEPALNNKNKNTSPGGVLRASQVLPNASPVQNPAPVIRPDGLDFAGVRRRTVLLSVLGVVVFGLVAGLLWWRFFVSDDGAVSNANISTTNQPSFTNVPVITNARPVSDTDNDTDNDGLTDAEEEKLGTDTTALDTDNDGLTDAHEVKLYLTDPLKKDTDGDGFSDGDEVKNLYNPNGNGKLFDFQSEKATNP